MARISMFTLAQAEGDLRELFEQHQRKLGFVPNYVRAFSLRPDAYRAWGEFLKVLRGKMRLRQYELIVIAATSAIGCHY